MIQAIPIILILIFCFSIRAYPRIKLKYGIASDSFFHIKHAQEIRKDNFRIFYELKNSVIKIIYSYPYLYHWLLALFPSRLLPWAERFTGAFFDTINLVIIYFFSNWYQDFNHLNLPYLSTTICFLYAVSPALLRFNGGPRSFNGSPRILAQTLYMIHIFAYYYYEQSSFFPALILSIVFGGYILVGSTFGTQVLLFFTPFYALFFCSDYLLVLLAYLIFILIASRGKVIRVLKGHFSHARFLAERISQQSPWQNNFLGYVRNMKEFLKSILKLQFKRAVPYFHDENYPIHNFLFYYPSFFIVLKYSYFLEHSFLYICVLSSVGLYIFTSFKKFKFLGEPVRYLDYSLVPSYLLTYFYLSENNALLWLYLFILYALTSLVYFLHQFYKMFFTNDSDYRNIEHCFQKINAMKQGNLFAFNSNGHLSYFFTQQPIVNALIGNLDVNLFSKEDSDLVIGNYPLPGKDWAKLVSRFDLKYVVLNRNELNQYTNKVLDNPDDFFNTVEFLFETKTAIFYKIK